MRPRAVVAATAGVVAAATGHWLDVTGRLPFVHESVAVRTAMSPAQVTVWLLAAATVSAVAATTRVVLVGAPCALLVSAAPELLARADPGAVFEPGALLGAAVQLVLLLAVAALASALGRRLAPAVVAAPRGPAAAAPSPPQSSVVASCVDRIAAPRAPPRVAVTST